MSKVERYMWFMMSRQWLCFESGQPG